MLLLADQPDNMKRFITTLLIAAAGALVFQFAGLPLPFLFGPMAASLIAALFGYELKDAKPISIGARGILGLAVGASITPQLITQIPEMGMTLLLMPVFVIMIGAVGMPFFTRVFGFDRATAYFASMPGALQDMVIFGTEAGGNARSLSLIHASRVLIIATVVPVLLSTLYGVTFTRPFGAHIWEIPVSELVIMVLASYGGFKIATYLNIFGASIIGPLIMAAILSLTGVLHYRPPTEAILFAQFFIGIGIGVNYIGTTLRELQHDVLAGVCFAIVLAVLTTIVTFLAVYVFGAPGVEAFLSFAPGGQAEMAVFALVTGADLGFVVLHHVVRMIVIVTGAPLVATRLFRQKASSDKPPGS